MTADHCCKFGEVAAKYDLKDYLDQLVTEWERQDDNGLRPLTTAFYQRVLRIKLTQTSRVPLEGELRSIAAGLNPDHDVAETTRGNAKARCRDHGLDPETLCDELPSYRTFARHARNCEGREAPQPAIQTDTGPEQIRETVRGYRGRLNKIFEDRIRALERAGHIECGEVELDLRFIVNCQDCGRRTPIQQIITAGCPGCSGVRE